MAKGRTLHGGHATALTINTQFPMPRRACSICCSCVSSLVSPAKGTRNLTALLKSQIRTSYTAVWWTSHPTRASSFFRLAATPRLTRSLLCVSEAVLDTCSCRCWPMSLFRFYVLVLHTAAMVRVYVCVSLCLSTDVIVPNVVLPSSTGIVHTCSCRHAKLVGEYVYLLA